MTKKQRNVNVNQSFLQTVAYKVILKEIRLPTTANVPVHLNKDKLIYQFNI